jgi:SAM-dependent methyltransferase
MSIDEIYSHPFWRQRIPLNDGKYTPGFRRDPSDWERFGLPEDLSGKSFLDIGAAEGLFAFEAEKRGAEDVLAMDIWGGGYENWDESGSIGQHMRQGLELVKSHRDSNIRTQQGDLMDISTDQIGTFDVVLCSGVFQFVSDIYTALKNLVDITEELLVLRGYTISLDTDKPVAKFSTDSSARIWEVTPEALFSIFKEIGDGSATRFDEESISVNDTLPAVPEGKTINQTKLYQSPSLNKERATIPSSERCKVAYEINGVYRIHHLDSYLQGWVQADSIETDPSEVKRILSSAQETLIENGISGFINESGHFLIRKGEQFIIQRSETMADLLSSDSTGGINIHYHA